MSRVIYHRLITTARFTWFQERAIRDYRATNVIQNICVPRTHEKNYRRVCHRFNLNLSLKKTTHFPM